MAAQFTVTVTAVVAVVVPATPVTVTVYWPAAVPGLTFVLTAFAPAPQPAAIPEALRRAGSILSCVSRRHASNVSILLAS